MPLVCGKGSSEVSKSDERLGEDVIVIVVVIIIIIIVIIVVL